MPAGLCYGLLGPNGAGKSTTMRILTGQAVADAGSVEVLGYRLPDESKLARARMGVCPQESNLDVDLGVRDGAQVFARLYRVGSRERPIAVERALALAGLEKRANDRAVTLSGGMQRRLLIARALIHGPEVVLLDEPTVGLYPQIRQELWSLIVSLRESGTTVLMSTHYIEEAQRLADRVAIMSAGRVVAEGTPSELILAHAGREVVDVHGSIAELAALRSQAEADGAADAPLGAVADLSPRRLARRAPAAGLAPERQPRGRVRPADGGLRRMSAVGTRRIETPALVAVWVREWTVFKYFWRTRTFAAIVEPVITLLAFGFGFGKLVSSIDGIPYIQFVGTGAVATAVLFSAVFSSMFDALYKRRYQRVYYAMLAAPVDVDEIVTGESLFIGVRAGLYGVAPLLVAFLFGLQPEPAMVLVPFIGALTGIGFAALGMWFATTVTTFDGFSYVISGVITPLFLVAGTFFPLNRMPQWLQSLAQLNPLYHCVELVRHCAFGLDPLADLVDVGALCAFALLAWWLAVWRTRVRLVV